MKIKLKLFASLAEYLPKEAKRNEVQIEVNDGSILQEVLDYYGVPPEQSHLVLVNGIYVAPSERSARILTESDTVAVWPPVAGG